MDRFHLLSASAAVSLSVRGGTSLSSVTIAHPCTSSNVYLSSVGHVPGRDEVLTLVACSVDHTESDSGSGGVAACLHPCNSVVCCWVPLLCPTVPLEAQSRTTDHFQYTCKELPWRVPPFFWIALPTKVRDSNWTATQSLGKRGNSCITCLIHWVAPTKVLPLSEYTFCILLCRAIKHLKLVRNSLVSKFGSRSKNLDYKLPWQLLCLCSFFPPVLFSPLFFFCNLFIFIFILLQTHYNT